MALGNRYKTAIGAGTLAALILVLVFGSPWYADWGTRNTNPDIVGGLKAILLIVLTALFLYLLPGSQLARARGTISQFFAGWGAYVFAGGFAALLTTLFLKNPSLL